MLDVGQALSQAARAPAAPALRDEAPRRALVVGAAGALGAAVLEQLLAARRFERVGALVEQPLHAALRGFEPVNDSADALHAFAVDTALVVHDRARMAFGREQAFVRPAPLALPALASRLQAAGARDLVVVVPHAPLLSQLHWMVPARAQAVRAASAVVDTWLGAPGATAATRPRL